MNEWQKYDDYKKKFCMIRLKNGKEFGPCWPNAGIFTVFNEKKETRIPESSVTHIRYLTPEEEEKMR